MMRRAELAYYDGEAQTGSGGARQRAPAREQRAERLRLEQLSRSRPTRRDRARRTSVGHPAVHAVSPAPHCSAASRELDVRVGGVEQPAHDELRRDRAVPAVLLEPERDVEARRAAAAGRAAADRRRSRCRRLGRAGERGTGGACRRRPCPRPTASQPATSRVMLRVAEPERCETVELLRPARASAQPPGRSRRPGHRAQLLVGEHRRPRGRRTPRRTPRAAPVAIESPAAARWPPNRTRCSAHAREAAVEVEVGDRPAGSLPAVAAAPAISTTGRLKRSTSREATIPITPSCQSSPQRT